MKNTTQPQTKPANGPIDLQRFEFSLKINKNHIICQRYFDIKGYNNQCFDSLEIKEMMDEIAGINIDNDGLGVMGIIPSFLKKASLDYLWGYFNPYKTQEKEDIMAKDENEKQDTFQFEVKVDGNVLAMSTFSGNLFPPKVRYQVNIRELIPDIISEIRHYLTKNTYTKKYGNVELKRKNLSSKNS